MNGETTVDVAARLALLARLEAEQADGWRTVTELPRPPLIRNGKFVITATRRRW